MFRCLHKLLINEQPWNEPKISLIIYYYISNINNYKRILYYFSNLWRIISNYTLILQKWINYGLIVDL